MGILLAFRKAEEDTRQNSKKSFSMIASGWSWITGVGISDVETSESTTIDVFS
jgi:hypothetical protein